MELLAYPWTQIIIGTTLVLGSMLAVILIVSKYPASKFLGLLVLSYLGLLIVRVSVPSSLYIQVGFIAFWTILDLYTKSFFNQKRRRSILYIMPIVLMASLTVLPDNMPWVIFIVEVVLAGLFLVSVIKTMISEGRSRGIQWFGNAGSRLIWFRNFISINTLLGLSFLLIPDVSLSALAASILLLLGVVMWQLIRESAFLSPIATGNKYQKSTLSPAIKSSILSKLDEVLEQDKFYLKDDVSLSSLAVTLGATTHHLSQVLNESRQITFQDLIAQYRIREAMRLLRDPSHQQIKIENIAVMVGYNSKSAFNTAFKRRTGHTPSTFKTLKRVQTYGEEHLPERKPTRSSQSPILLSHTFSSKSKTAMIRNFLKSFTRNLNRNKVFTAINLFGLTLAFTCSLFIYLFISDELSYDRQIQDHDQVYRINWINDNPQTRTPHPMAQAMVRDWPEVASAVSISPWYDSGLNREKVRVENQVKNVVFEEQGFFFVDSTFFEVFGIEVIEGDENALSDPFTLVITDVMAAKYFGEENAVGKELRINDMPIMVSTVVKGFPKNSHFHFQALLSYVTLKTINPEDNWLEWGDFGHFNYLKMKPGADAATLQSKLPEWVIGYNDWTEDEKAIIRSAESQFVLQPITDIHLNSNLRWELENNGNILYVYILSATLIFLLVIACINYVNLTTARSMERAKDIGVRKTLGAISQSLSLQFYLESVLFSLFAAVLSLLFAFLGLNTFNLLSGKSIEIQSLLNTALMLKALGVCLGIGLLAGAYPAVIMSSFQPAAVLNGKLTSSGKGIATRGVLVTVQFMISAILIAGSMIIVRQVNYMKDKELGFDQAAVISMSIPTSVETGGIDLNKVRTFQERVAQLSGVKYASATSNVPGSSFNQHPIYALNNPENRVDASEAMFDYGMRDVLNYNLVAGRDFDRAYAADSSGTNFILNQAAVAALNLEDPVGERVVWVNNDEEVEGNVIGVVEGFHYRSLHETIQPLILQVRTHQVSNFVLKLEGQSFQSTLSTIAETYLDMYPKMPFEYHFLDEKMSALYDQEQKTLAIFSVFAGVALVLACLGLVGMALAMLSQRIKEIGMRKIMGASSFQIAQLIAGQFLKLILIALVLGLPLAYFLMQDWLNEFSYQSTIGLLPFLYTAIILVIIAVLSISSAVLKMAVSQPIDSLRYE